VLSAYDYMLARRRNSAMIDPVPGICSSSPLSAVISGQT
jgi:hypothetical protein